MNWTEGELREMARLHAPKRDWKSDWDGRTPVDESENIVWPLAKWLRQAGRLDDLKMAGNYRRTYTAANSNAQLGGAGVVREEVSIDHRSVLTSDGIAYKEMRQSRAAGVAIPPKRSIPAAENDNFQIGKSTAPKPWAGDSAVNDMIDAKTRLAKFQSKLGPLVAPFELAVIENKKIEEVGELVGQHGRQAMSGGAALLNLAFASLNGWCTPKVDFGGDV